MFNKNYLKMVQKNKGNENYRERRSSHEGREGVWVSFPDIPKTAETTRSSTAMTGHHCLNLKEEKALLRS